MKGHLSIAGDYTILKPIIEQIDDIGRYRDGGRSFAYDDGHCRVDYFYDDYDLAELDYEIVTTEENKSYIKLEEW